MSVSPPGVPGPHPLRLGRYEILRRLAAGGMAEIFLARARDPTGFEKIVVIKRILPELAVQPDFVTMFLDEARLAAAMHHPNIVQTFDIGVDGDSYFMTMEYLHGQDLRALIRALRVQRLTLPIDKAVHIIGQVLAGLQHAHDQRGADGNPLELVHRDVSPQNVIVTYDGAVKLLDFGIAKAQGRFGGTRYGTLKGKIGYMSPEQCRGEPLDGRSDVFTATILLFELTTGRRLYRGENEFDVLKRIIEGPVPSPRTIDSSYPAELDRIVVRGLAKRAATRYPSARKMAEELEAFALDEGMLVTPLALSRYMEEVFGKKVEAWRADSTSVPEPIEMPGGLGDEDGGGSTVRQLDTATEGTAPPAVGEADGAEAVSTPASQEREVGADSRSNLPQARLSEYVVPLGVFTLLVLIGSLSGVMYLRRSVRPAAAPADTGESTIGRAVLAPLPGAIKVVTTPPGAAVFLDGRRIGGRTPTTIEGMAPGATHLLVVEREGYLPEVRHVVPPAGGRAMPVAIELIPESLRRPPPIPPPTPGPPQPPTIAPVR